jgi:hypothetical protein
MPFVFARAPDEDGEHGDGPPLDQYPYIPPPQFGGAPEPVHFSIEPLAPEPETAEPPRSVELRSPVEYAPPPPAPPRRRSFLDIRPGLRHGRLRLVVMLVALSFAWRMRLVWRRTLLGWRNLTGSPQPTARACVTVVLQPQPQRDSAQRRQHLFAIAIPELQKAGVRRAYCRYDGGHDEGFAWPDYFEMQDGTRISPRDLAGRLHGAGLADRLTAAEVINRHAFLETDLDVLRRLCFEWASLLLGNGYGTGEYSMYGAFTVDLEACTITDDRIADPVGHRNSKFG